LKVIIANILNYQYLSLKNDELNILKLESYDYCGF
jgi:hypothetical protein